MELQVFMDTRHGQRQIALAHTTDQCWFANLLFCELVCGFPFEIEKLLDPASVCVDMSYGPKWHPVTEWVSPISLYMVISLSKFIYVIAGEMDRLRPLIIRGVVSYLVTASLDNRNHRSPTALRHQVKLIGLWRHPWLSHHITHSRLFW